MNIIGIIGGLSYCAVCPSCWTGQVKNVEKRKNCYNFLFISPDFKSKFELERKDTDCYNTSATSGSQPPPPSLSQPPPHPSPLLPTPPHPFSSSSSSSSAGVSGAGGVAIATPAHLPDSTTDSWSGYFGAQRPDGVGKPFSGKSLKQRCRDYDGEETEEISLLPIHLFDFTVSFWVRIDSEALCPVVNTSIIFPRGLLIALFSVIANDRCLALPLPSLKTHQGLKLPTVPGARSYLSQCSNTASRDPAP